MTWPALRRAFNPLDIHAPATEGQSITLADLKRGLEPFETIRRAGCDRIEIMAELHSLWSYPAALRICQALEPLAIAWAEDLIGRRSLGAARGAA